MIDPIGLSLFDAPSRKAALDIDWADAGQKQQALQRLCDELDALQDWIGAHFPRERHSPPLAAALHTLQALRAQDREPDPVEGGSRIRQGVAKDRQISITDPEMRHGRQSSSSRFDGYKRHIAQDLDEEVILAAEVLPANRPDTAGLEPLLIAVELQHRQVTALRLDRGYLGDDLIPPCEAAGAAILCRPWPAPARAGQFSKRDFHLDLAGRSGHRSGRPRYPHHPRQNRLLSDRDLRSLRAARAGYVPQDRGPNLAHPPSGRPLATSPGATDHPRGARRLTRTGRGRARFGPCQPTPGE